MSIVGFAILVSLVLLLIWLYTVLAKMPGDKARERNHPQADAINVLGWIGLLLGVAPWLVALVWAYMRTDTGQVAAATERVNNAQSN
jgi:uncharacterized membrane protein YfcA